MAACTWTTGSLACVSRVGNLPLVIFFFTAPATTEIYTFPTRRSSDLSSVEVATIGHEGMVGFRSLLGADTSIVRVMVQVDRKSTRLNSSHANISYAVFCLKKKKRKKSYAIWPAHGFIVTLSASRSVAS